MFGFYSSAKNEAAVGTDSYHCGNCRRMRRVTRGCCRWSRRCGFFFDVHLINLNFSFLYLSYHACFTSLDIYLCRTYPTGHIIRQGLKPELVLCIRVIPSAIYYNIIYPFFPSFFFFGRHGHLEAYLVDPYIEQLAVVYLNLEQSTTTVRRKLEQQACHNSLPKV